MEASKSGSGYDHKLPLSTNIELQILCFPFLFHVLSSSSSFHFLPHTARFIDNGTLLPLFRAFLSPSPSSSSSSRPLPISFAHCNSSLSFTIPTAFYFHDEKSALLVLNRPSNCCLTLHSLAWNFRSEFGVLRSKRMLTTRIGLVEEMFFKVLVVLLLWWEPFLFLLLCTRRYLFGQWINSISALRLLIS